MRHNDKNVEITDIENTDSMEAFDSLNGQMNVFGLEMMMFKLTLVSAISGIAGGVGKADAEIIHK